MPFTLRPRPVTAPQNSRVVDAAKERLTQITPLAQQQLQNSLAVNGWPCIIYHKLTGGRACTCRVPVAAGTSVESPIFDEQGNASQEHINTLLTGNRFSIGDYGRQDNRNDDPAPQPVTLTPVHRGIEGLEVGHDVGDPLAEIILDDEVSTTTVNPDGMDNGACAVCFGTGYVGGYRVNNGWRAVLDSRHETIKLDLAQTDQTRTPFRVEFFQGGSAEFSLTLPKSLTPQRAQVWDNDTLTPLKVEWMQGNQWVTLTSAAFLGLPVRIRVRGPDGAKFTHIELQGMYQQLTPVEFPHIAKTGDTQVLDGTQPVSLSIGPQVQQLNPGDLVADSVYGRLWRITDTTSLSDGQRRQLGWDTNARIVQEYERLAQLYTPQPRDLTPRRHTSTEQPAGQSLRF